MERYMEEFLIPIAKDKLSKYRETAQKAGELFVNHHTTSLEGLMSIDQQGTLNLFLAPATGDERCPFAQFHSFWNLSSHGDLTRSNKLAPVVDWAVSP